MILLLLTSSIYAQPAKTETDESKLSPNVNGNWMVGYQDAELGFVEGTAIIDRNDVTVNLYHPKDGSIHTLESVSVEWLSKTRMRVRLHGESPHGEKVEKPDIADMVKLEVSPQRDLVEIKSGPYEDMIPIKHALEAWGEYVDVELEYKDDTFTGQWFYVADPQTQRNANGFGRVGNFKIDEVQGRKYASQSGVEVWERKKTRILASTVIGDQMHYDHDIYDYPYPWAEGEVNPYGQSRSIFVVGENLPKNYADPAEFESGDPEHIRYRTNIYDNQKSIAYNKPFFDKAWQSLLSKYDESVHDELLSKQAIIVTAYMDEGVIPGPQHFKLNGASANWTLQFGDNLGTLSFVRKVTTDEEYETLTDVLRPSVIYLQVYTKHKMPMDEIPLILGFKDALLEMDNKTGELKFIPTPQQAPSEVLRESNENVENKESTNASEPSAETAEQQTEEDPDNYTLLVKKVPHPVTMSSREPAKTGQFYRSEPIVLIGANDPAPKDIRLHIRVNKGDTLNAMIAKEGLLKIDPAVTTVNVNHIPADLGSTWLEALIKAASCHDDVEPVELRQKTAHRVDTISNLIVTELSIARNYVTLGDHAAMLLLREEFIKASQEQLDFLNGIRGQAMLWTWANMIRSQMSDRNSAFHHVTVTAPNGDPLYFSAIWQTEWISEYFGITPRRAREWANRALAEGMENLKAQISQAMSDAKEIDTCELEDLLELTGYGFDAMVDRVKQRLVKIERVGDPARTQWVPDLPAHAAVSSLHQLADAVQAQEEYAKLDTAFAITCAALVAIPIASGGSVVGTAIAYGIDLADLGITLATQVPEYIEDKERVAFARNAMMVLGSDRLAEAKAREMSAMELGLSVLGAGVGGVAGRAQFLDSIRNIPIRQLRREGARLAKQVQGGGLDALKQLSPEDQAKYMAYIADIKQISSNARTGRLGLTWSQNRALSRFENLQKQAQELAAATARNTDEVTTGATNSARVTNAGNTTTDATSTVARDSRHQLDGMRYEDLPAVTRADDVPPTTVVRQTDEATEQTGMADALNRASRDSELPMNPRQPDMPTNPARNIQPDAPDMPRRAADTDVPDSPRRTADADSLEVPRRVNEPDTTATPSRTAEANTPARTANNTTATPRQPANTNTPVTPRRTATNNTPTDVNRTRRFDDGFDDNIPPATPRRAAEADMPTQPRRTASDSVPTDTNKTRRFSDGFDDNIPPATPSTPRRTTTSSTSSNPTRNATAQPPVNTRSANSTLPPTPHRTADDLLPPAPRPTRTAGTTDTPSVTNRSRTAANDAPADVNKTRRFEDGFDENIPPAPPLTKADLDPPRARDVDPSVRRPVTQEQADDIAKRINKRLEASKKSMARLQDQAKTGNLKVSPKAKRALQDRIDNLSQRKAILDDVLEGLKNGKHHELSDADMRWLTGRDVDLSPAQRAALKNTLMNDFGGSWKAATDNLMGSPTDKVLLQKLGTLRKHEVDKLLDDIMRRIEAKTGQKLEAQAFGSTTLTSDYDLSIKGPGAERVITEFNQRYRKLYGGRESGTVFDTNVYTDPVYSFIPPDSALAKALGPKGADDVQQFMYEHMANAKYMTPGQWQKHVNEVLNATPGRHKGAIKRLLEEVESREFASRAAINKRINELGLDPSDANSRLRAQNDLYGQTLTRIDELRQYQNGLDLLADGKPASFKIPRKDQSSAFASNLRRYNELISDTNPATQAASKADAKELLDRMRTSLSGNLRNNQGAALYYASEAYQTEGTIKHVVGELQKDKRVIDPDILKSPLAEDPPLTRGQYINSFNENRGNLFKELNDKGVLDDAGRFRRDLTKVDDRGNIVPLTEAERYKIAKKSAMKTSKYFVRQLDAAHRAGVDLKHILGEDLTRVIDETVALEKVRNDGDAFALVLKKLKLTPEQFVNRAMEASDLLTGATHRFSPVRGVGDDLTKHFDQLDDELAEFRRFNRPANGSAARPRRLSRSELRHRLDDNPTMRLNDRFDENIPSASRADLPRTTRFNDDFDANLPTANRTDIPKTTRINDGFDESLPTASRTELPRTTRIKDGFNDNLPTASRTDLPRTKRIKDGFDENLPGTARTELPSATKRFDDILPTPSKTLPNGTRRFDDVLPNPRTPVARDLPTPAARMPDVDDGLTPRVATPLDPNAPIRIGNDPSAPVFGGFDAGQAPLPTPRLDPQPIPGGFGFNPAARNNPFDVPTPAPPKPADFGFVPAAPKAKPIELPKSFSQAAQPTPLPTRTYSTGDVVKTADGKQLTVGKPIGEGAYSRVFAIKERPGEVIKFLKTDAAEKAGRDAIEMVHDAKRISDLLEARGVRQMKVTEINPDPANPYVIVQKLPDEGKLVDHKELYNAAEAGKRQAMIKAGKWSDQHEEAVLDLYAEMARKNIIWYDGHLDNVYFIPVKMPDGTTKLKAGVIDHDMIGDWDSLSPAMREKINDLTLKNRNENMASLKTHGLLYDYGSAQEFMTKMLEFKRFINYDYHANEFESLIMNLDTVRNYFKLEDYLGPGAKTQSYRLPERRYRSAA
ncbi:MAG: hypothetical protein CMJ19_16530 [Phycisphaeraceae bacterium]|nr:hypothetical protein [Phycisphaeraceae bacterium]